MISSVPNNRPQMPQKQNFGQMKIALHHLGHREAYDGVPGKIFFQNTGIKENFQLGQELGWIRHYTQKLLSGDINKGLYDKDEHRLSDALWMEANDKKTVVKVLSADFLNPAHPDQDIKMSHYVEISSSEEDPEQQRELVEKLKEAYTSKGGEIGFLREEPTPTPLPIQEKPQVPLTLRQQFFKGLANFCNSLSN